MATQIAQPPRRDADAMARTTHALERLMDVPISVWRDTAIEVTRAESPTLVVALARALREHGHPFDVWSVRDDVDTVMYRFECRRGLAGWSTPTIRAVRRATEHAALAMLLGSVLPRDVYGALTAHLLGLVRFPAANRRPSL